MSQVNQRKSELCVKKFKFSASTDGPGPCSAILTGNVTVKSFIIKNIGD
jgi:hypothetical protein